MGGSKHLKRAAAPAAWKIPRKTHKFTIRTAPGPHPKDESYPLAVLVRDVLKLVKTHREAKVAIKEGKILVDGVVRRALNFPVGLMDIIDIPSIGKAYRILPTPNNPLNPVEVESNGEKKLKLCRVKTKTTIKGGIIQYGLHDGRTIRAVNGDATLKPDDTLLIEVPTQKVIEAYRMEPGSLALVVKGKMAGRIGRITGVKPGTITRPKMVTLKFDEEESEVPARLLLVVGRDKPALTIPGWAG